MNLKEKREFQETLNTILKLTKLIAETRAENESLLRENKFLKTLLLSRESNSKDNLIKKEIKE